MKRLLKKCTDYYSNFGAKQFIKAIFLKSYYTTKLKLQTKESIIKENDAVLSELIRNNKKLLVAFSVIPWCLRFQRPQHILKGFAKDSYLVLYIDTNMAQSKETIIEKITDGIYNVTLSINSPFSIYCDNLSEEICNNMNVQILNILNKINPKNVIYLVQFPNWNNLVQKIKKSFNGKLVFDFMDEHSGFSNTSKEVITSELDLLKISDLVITTSDALFKKSKNLNDNTTIVRNGTEFEHFNKLKPNGELDYLKNKPIIGYYGAIAEWFDNELVEYCAINRPEYNFVLIGSTVGSNISKLKSLKNVYLLGEIDYKTLPSYLYYFDVCTIPFKILPLTLATNPVKFYEYISSGKPVVSTKLPELNQYSDCCYLADNLGEFLKLIDDSLSEDKSLVLKKRIQLAKENSWKSRYAKIKEELRNN